jgi:hypothetical protein
MIFYPLIISCLFASFANANEIENLVNTAQRLDSQVSNSNEAIKASEMRLRNISRIFNPVVNIGIGTTSTNSSSWGLENTPKYKESYGAGNYNIALSQSIYNSLKNYDIEEAGVQVEYEANLLRSMRNENAKLVLQVILDRYLVLRSIKNTENELYLITQHMAKIENDKSKKIEFYNYKDRKLQASENLINSKTNLAQLNSLLENVVGLDNAKKQFKISNSISLDALRLPAPGQLIEDSKIHNINVILKKSELTL